MGTELLTGFWLCQGYWPQTQEIWDIVPLDSSPAALLGIGHIQSKGCAENTGEGVLQGAPKAHRSGVEEQHILKNIQNT